jgi:hypothetical protein
MMTALVIVALASWTIQNALAALSSLRQAEYWKTANAQIAAAAAAAAAAKSDDDDEDEDDEGGGSKPVTPYDIDPDFDPGDWWKHETKKAV